MFPLISHHKNKFEKFHRLIIICIVFNSPVPKIHFSSNGHIKKKKKKIKRKEGRTGEGERERDEDQESSTSQMRNSHS